MWVSKQSFLEHNVGLHEYLINPTNLVVHVCHILVLMMHLCFGLAKRATRVLVHGLCSVLLLGNAVPLMGESGLAMDLATIFGRYHLDPVLRSYVCCPLCFALYDPESAPSRCTFKEFVDSPSCGADLFKTRSIRGKEHVKPVRIYLHQDFKEWLGRFLSRPDIEDLLIVPPPAMLTKFMEDIWHGSVLAKDFVGPDGKNFHSRADGTLRLIFGLAVDGFNSYRNIQAKKKATSTGIYMVCFNLPPDVRYLPENMYLVGVIPGKPSLDQINHSLQLLVNDLKPFWSPGVYYTQTANRAGGSHVTAAIVPLISDLLAGRQVAGFGAVGHNFFCTCCLLPLSDIENFDTTQWPPRTWKFHCRGVKAWREASNAEERKEAFQKYGARWSALLDLPYWNALYFTIIDSMHNNYLGLIQNHLRSVWGMNINAEDGEGLSDPNKKPPPVPDHEDMQNAITTLASGDKEALLKLRRHILWHLCASHNLRRAKDKKKMVKTLLDWVSTFMSCSSDTL